MKSTVDTFNLRAFAKVVDCGSVSSAARELCLSQAGVSMLLHRLEMRYQASLLKRRAGAMVPTPAGEALYKYAKRVLKAEEWLEHRLDFLRETDAGLVRVGATATIAGYVLPPLLSFYKLRHPEIRISLHSARREVLCQELLSGLLDFILVVGECDERLESTPIHRERVVIVAAPDPSLKDRTLEPSELLRQPFVFSRPSSGLRARVEQALGCTQRSRLTVSAELDDPEAKKEAVRRGLGYGVMLESLVRRDLALGLLAEVKVRGVALSADFRLARRSGANLSADAEALYAALLPTQSLGTASLLLVAPAVWWDDHTPIPADTPMLVTPHGYGESPNRPPAITKK